MSVALRKTSATMSADQAAERSDMVAEAIASARMEGAWITELTRQALDRFAEGEIDEDEAMHIVLRTYGPGA